MQSNPSAVITGYMSSYAMPLWLCMRLRLRLTSHSIDFETVPSMESTRKRCGKLHLIL